MTIQQLGSLGEFVAAVATLVTLVYLALQIRANTTALTSSSRQGATSHGLHFQGILGENREAASIFRRGLGDLESLDPDELIQFTFLFSMIVSQADNIYVDYSMGVIPVGVMESSTNSLIKLSRTPGGRNYWSLYADSHTPEFKAFMMREIAS